MYGIRCPDSGADGDALLLGYFAVYEGWNFNSGNYLFTSDTK